MLEKVEELKQQNAAGRPPTQPLAPWNKSTTRTSRLRIASSKKQPTNSPGCQSNSQRSDQQTLRTDDAASEPKKKANTPMTDCNLHSQPRKISNPFNQPISSHRLRKRNFLGVFREQYYRLNTYFNTERINRRKSHYVKPIYTYLG